jgi:NAD(P)-dependent dehydrogenase (short-subunit alcohol dehydrogenase family)
VDERKPKPPFPEQHLPKPGLEHDLRPRPFWEAPDYQPAGKLEGRRALITGGDSGIGRAVAYMFAREGADIAFTHLPSERADAEQLLEAIEACGRKALRVDLDQRDFQACEAVVAQVLEELGGLDILVNNAAYQQHCRDVADLSIEQWRLTFETNIYGYFHMTKAALPALGPGSAIINTGSITGLEGSKELVDYASTKGAIHAFTKSLAQNLLERGIRVNCVAPGPVWTPLNPADRAGEDVAKFGSETPMGRPAQPEEIAPIYVYFASNADSSYVTGEVFTLLGGQTRAA